MLKAKLMYKVFKLMQQRVQGSNWLETPMIPQRNLLQSILKRQASTIYGQKYEFVDISSERQFQNHVPLTMYDDYVPYFTQIKEGISNVLFKDQQIAWLQTSGTTKEPKLFPFTDYMAQRLEMAPLNLYLSYIEENPREHLRCLSGKFLSIVADPEVGRLNGLPIGYISGVALALKAESKMAARLFTPTLDVLKMKDWEVKYRAISEQATQQNVSLIAGVPVYIADYLTKLETRYKHELGLSDKTIPEIWPNLKLIIWSGAKVDGYKTRLTQLVGSQVDYREAYGATETGLMAFQNGTERGMIPVLGNNFFEFISLHEWRAMEAENADYHTFEFGARTFQDVKPGIEYVIVFTTVGGLYRYIIGDVVVFEHSDLPRFRWTGRIKWWSNITVERMSYGHVLQAIAALEEDIGFPINNFSYSTCYRPPQYHFVIETESDKLLNSDLSARLDQLLQLVNCEYAFARERGLLHAPLVIQVPPGTYDQFSQVKARQGAPLGQMKPPGFTDIQTLNLLASLATY
ncbi:MAG: GH3 auxin-responsive promoter family protein [Promethearchaeota archaeon]